MLASSSVVWEVEYLRSAEAATHDDLSISEMTEEQVEAYSTASPELSIEYLEELLRNVRGAAQDSDALYDRGD